MEENTTPFLIVKCSILITTNLWMCKVEIAKKTSHELMKLSRPFFFHRLHSILGLWLVIYLFEHLLVNSQMALFFKDNGSSFIKMVNQIHALPYLRLIEILFLGLPFLIHGIWGVVYARTGKSNSKSTVGTKPALPQYKRNRAYSWQRITSWLLIVGIIAHVIHMRFVEYPIHVQKGEDKGIYMSRLTCDPGLFVASKKLEVDLYNTIQIGEKQKLLIEQEALLKSLSPDEYQNSYYKVLQEVNQQHRWLKGAEKKTVKKGGSFSCSSKCRGSVFFNYSTSLYKSFNGDSLLNFSDCCDLSCF